jgi:site-specific DNA recombinase
MAQTVIENKRGIALDSQPTAVIYLRVSSPGQLTGPSVEGYSIEGQREACERHARQLGAVIVDEFIEPGKTGTNTRRPALQRMLNALEDLRPTFAIFYDLSRVARDDFDALWLLREIEAHGCKLESTLERTDHTPAGRLLYTIMAGVNAFRSRSDAEKVKMGLQRKFADGGSIGKAPIGYMNTRERIGGREVRVVAIDPERAPLVRTAFEAYATGDFSISDIRDLLDQTGLRTRETPRKAPGPLSRTQVHRMLCDEFYVGVVTWGGAKNPNGLHPPLIDRAMFEKVQETLKSAMLSGNRTRKHKHYLRGSVFCGRCGRRMAFHRVKGKGGIYDYYRCLEHQRRDGEGGCRHLLVSRVEKAVERYYAQVRLTPSELQAVRKAVSDYAAEQLGTAQRESARHERRLQDLQREQQKLLQLFYKNSIDEAVLGAEQERIDVERSEAERWIELATHETAETEEALGEALELLDNADVRYRQAEPQVRRLINQALFDALLISEDDSTKAKPHAWVTEIHRVARMQSGPRARRRSDHDRLSAAGGFNKTEMVPRAGLEPAPPD